MSKAFGMMHETPDHLQIASAGDGMVLAGDLKGIIDFGSGVSFTSEGDYPQDFFVAKLDATLRRSGSRCWTRPAGWPSAVTPRGA